MSLALVLYFVAFFAARRVWAGHIVAALSALSLDLYATYLMEVLRLERGLVFGTYPFFLKLHTAIALLALFAFACQATLGILAKRRVERARQVHVYSAKFFFLPVWVAAYASGMYILL